MTKLTIPIFAQAATGTGQLQQGLGIALGIIMAIAFIFGVIQIIGGVRQVRNGEAPALVFARTGDGKVHRLVDAKAALEVVRDMGLKTEERPIGNTMQDADRAAREASLIRRTVQERAVTVVLDKLTKHKNCTEKSLQLALSWLAQDAGFETKKAILRGRGLDPKEAHNHSGSQANQFGHQDHRSKRPPS